MDRYEQNMQDMKTQAEYNKKKDDKLEKGMIAAAAILGGIALYNAATHRTVPNETLKSIFDDKLTPKVANTVPAQPIEFPYQYNGKIPEDMLNYQDNLGATLSYALQDENTRDK